MASVRSASQFRVPAWLGCRCAGPSKAVARPSAANTGATASCIQEGPLARMVSSPASAGPWLPDTGASKKVTRYRVAVLTKRCVHSSPTVAICTQIRPEPISSSPSGPRNACSVAGPSASMVMRIWAPLTASAGLAAAVAPSLMRAAAWLAVRSQARTRKPARARLAAIGPPIRPVPRNAITGGAVCRVRPGRAGVICCAGNWVVRSCHSFRGGGRKSCVGRVSWRHTAG